MSQWKVSSFNVTFGGAPAPAASMAADPVAAARWQAEGDRLRLAGDVRAADVAYARQMRATATDPALVQAADAMIAGDLRFADATLRNAIRRRPDDPVALWMLADVASRTRRNAEAETLLARCLQVAPGFTAARYAYALVLSWLDRPADTLIQAERLLAETPTHPLYRHLRASSLLRLGRDPEAATAYAAILEAHPELPLTWMSYGHVLKTIGRQADAVAAYRRALDLDPRLGEAWWSLANLKTVRFTEADVAAMQATSARPDLQGLDRIQLQFALGKAQEDARQFAASFAHYAQGAAMQRARLAYDPDAVSDQTRRGRQTLTADLFATRAGQGAQHPDPIFIVGLPRSGSTLVEQILASHSQVEGTQELPYLPVMAARLDARGRAAGAGYPEVLRDLTPDELRGLGEQYLGSAQPHRTLGRPFFIDKLPNNFAHAGLIQLILPQAKIIDVRRHPVGCCFSAFKQHFAVGQAFSYDLTDLGRYYADYVALMAHIDTVLPGRVHRVIYERLVDDLEGETRALLEHCGLPFEAACLRFFENDRPVHTASSEQVRQPIFTDATAHWRHFEPWLGPLKTALGPTLAAYPAAP